MDPSDRAFKTFVFAIFIPVVLLLFEVPGDLAAERKGIKKDGIVSDYEARRLYYPIVKTERNGVTVELKSQNPWSYRWYKVGEHVPVLDTGGTQAFIGSPLVRWGPNVVMACVAVISTFGLMREYRKRRRPWE